MGIPVGFSMSTFVSIFALILKFCFRLIIGICRGISSIDGILIKFLEHLGFAEFLKKMLRTFSNLIVNFWYLSNLKETKYLRHVS